jgi:membrane-bound ClpP family serine protease
MTSPSSTLAPSPRITSTNKTAFVRINRQYFYATLALMVVGFVCMGMDTEQYGFGVLGLTVGPLLLLIGFIMPFFAIMSKTGNETIKQDVDTSTLISK